MKFSIDVSGMDIFRDNYSICIANEDKDNHIIRVMYASNRDVSGSYIAKSINISSPAIKPRLVNLQNRGIVRPKKIGGMRTFKRTFGESKKQIISKHLAGYCGDLI